MTRLTYMNSVIAISEFSDHPFEIWKSSNKTDSMMWLRDLLPHHEEFKESRIRLWGYQSRIDDSVNKISMQGFAENLLTDILKDREGNNV